MTLKFDSSEIRMSENGRNEKINGDERTETFALLPISSPNADYIKN
jgi:hypothetical protein